MKHMVEFKMILLRKENGCLFFVRLSGVGMRERMNALSILEDEAKTMCFIGVHGSSSVV